MLEYGSLISIRLQIRFVKVVFRILKGTFSALKMPFTVAICHLWESRLYSED